MTKAKRILIRTAAAAALIFGAVGVRLACGSLPFTASAEGESTQINLADYNTLHWELYPHGSELGSGTVYRYQYLLGGEWKDYFTTSLITAAPEFASQGWRLVSVETVSRSIVNVHTDSFVHELRLVSPYSEYFSVTYSGGYQPGEGSGEYRAQAEIELTDDAYSFVYVPDREIEQRGMTVAIDGDRATVTQVWYAAYSENEFLDEDESTSAGGEVGYTLPSWTFGAFNGAKPPRLRHGDELLGGAEQAEGYWASSEEYVFARFEDGRAQLDAEFEAVTFSLWREGELLEEDCPRKQWNYYFNDFMPAGRYRIVFTAKELTVSTHEAWWATDTIFQADGGGISYRTITRAYEFEVYAGELALPDEELNGEILRVELSSFAFGDYSALFKEAEGRVRFADYIGLAQVLTGNTYWSINAQDYFDTFPRLSYRVVGAERADYLFASADWDGILNREGTFTVYYRAEMRNYAPSPSDAEESFRHFFTAEVYVREDETATAEIRDSDGNTVKFSVSGLRSGIALSAADGLSESDRNALDKAGFYVLSAFDLVLREGNRVVSPTHSVTVGISRPASLQSREDVLLVAVNGAGEVRICAYTEADGMLYFAADDVGTVCFVTPVEAVPEPGAGGGADTALIVLAAVEGAAVLGLAGALFGVTVVRKRKK